MHKKKLLGSTLAIAALFTYGTANAELFKGLRFGGQFDLQTTSARNVTDFNTSGAGNNDRLGDAQTRVMLHAMWSVLDDVTAAVTLRKNDRSWGTTGGRVIQNGQGAGSVSQPVNAPGANVLGSIYVDQAFIKIDKLMGAIDGTFGRQFYGESGDLVGYFGPSDKPEYGLPVNAIDAARFDWSNDMVGVTGLAGKTVGTAVGQTAASAGAANPIDVRTVNVAFKGHENLSAGVYGWNQVTHANGDLGTPGGFNDNLWVIGAKVKAMLGTAAWVGVEGAKNFGENRDVTGPAPFVGSAHYEGWAAKADAGMKAEIAGVGALMPWAHFGVGSGDNAGNDNVNHGFVAIAPDYRPGTINGRFAASPLGTAGDNAALGSGTGGNAGIASTSLSNRVVWGGGVKVMPGAWQKLTAGVSIWDFSLQKRQTSTLIGNEAAGRGNKHLGSEVDLDLTWKHSDNVTLGAGAARWWNGGYIMNVANQAGAGNSPVTLAYFDVRVKWGGQ